MRAAKKAALEQKHEQAQAVAAKQAQAAAKAAEAAAAKASREATLKEGSTIEASILLVFTVGSVCVFVSLVITMAKPSGRPTRPVDDAFFDELPDMTPEGGYGTVATINEDPEEAADSLADENPFLDES